MTCPRCGLPDAGERECARCGVVFAKLRSRPEPASPAPPPPSGVAPGIEAPLQFQYEFEADASSPLRRGLWLGAGAVAVGVIAGLLAVRASRSGGPAPQRQRRPLQARSAPAPVQVPAPAAAENAAESAPTPPPAPAEEPRVSVFWPDLDRSGLPQADREAARALGRRAQQSVGSAEVAEAEALVSRYPDEPMARDILAHLLLRAGQAAQRQARPAEAADYYQRAGQLLPAQVALRHAALNLRLEAGDWSGAESAAREWLKVAPQEPEALVGLGWALFRQDRNREAADALRQALAIRDDGSARGLLARIEKGLTDERGMTEQRLSHFHVRYDGEEHDDVGREILRALERHYATLVVAFSHQPAATLPVILFSRERYYDASGAPAWSGGAYDNLDGRIRIPIGGLTPALTADIDETLIHEVAHAFIADMSRGAATRELHEGVAQYMEGKRIDSLLEPEQLRALADGRGRGVGGFYLQALSFAEFLYAQRGQGGINSLLASLGETGDVNAASRSAFGQDYAALQRDWAEWLKRRYGS